MGGTTLRGMNLMLHATSLGRQRIFARFQLGDERLFWIVWALLLGHRVLLLLRPESALFYDEIYYYHWSLNPDFGYYSKPPMVAWLIGLSSQLFGHTSVGIKIGATLCWHGTSVILFILARRYWNPRVALITGLVFATSPLVGFYSQFVTTDAVLLLFWSLSILFFLRALDRDNTGDWILAGLFTGAGLLSKYTLILLPFAYFLYLVCAPKQRAVFTRPGPWIAGVLALALFGLNIVWNLRNNFVAWRHTSEISQLSGLRLEFVGLLEFLASQVLIFGPVSGVLLLWALSQRSLLRAALQQSRALRVVCVAGLTLLSVICCQALFSRAFANWAAPVFISASLLFGVLFQHRTRAVQIAIGANLVLLLCFHYYPNAQAALGIEPTRSNSPYVRVLGWDQVAQAIAPFWTPPSIHPAHSEYLGIASDSRKLLAYSGYHLHIQPEQLMYWNANVANIRNYYDQKNNLIQWQGTTGPLLLILEHPITPPQAASFGQVQALDRVDAYHPSVSTTTSLYLYRVEQFLGYANDTAD